MNLKHWLTLTVALSSFHALSHEVWIKPDAFELNSDEQQVYAIDVSRSALAYVAEANHHVDELMVTGPDGKQVVATASFSGQTKEVFELPFSAPGTYHLQTPQTQVFLTFYRDSEGKKHKVRMPKSRYHELPEGAKPIKTVEKQMTSEAYISYNGFSEVTPQSDSHISIVPAEHPNKLNVDTPLTFQIMYDGQPLRGAEVSLKSWNHLYDHDQDELEVASDERGSVSFEVDHPGRYLLVVEHQLDLPNGKLADSRSVEKFLSFDVTR